LVLAKLNEERFTYMTGDDAELVALIDNQLDEEAKGRLLARLAEDERLRQRYEELRDAGVPIAASLDALLKKGPLARLRSALPSVSTTRLGRWAFSGVALRDLAAGFVLGLLAAGAAAWVGFSGAPSDDRADWRSVVAEYMELYTNETFALRNPDQTIEALKLNVVAKRVAVALTPEKVSLPGFVSSPQTYSHTAERHWAKSRMSTPAARQRCSASSPMEEPTRGTTRRSAEALRCPHGRMADEAIY
jgi:hypothetical protein